MLARLCPFVLIALFACSIVDDDAITTPQELEDVLAKLKLESIVITQHDGTGNTTFTKTVEATLKKNTVVSLATTEGKVTLYQEFDVPALELMKFRSGVTSAVQVGIHYLEDGRPYGLSVLSGTVTHESYNFLYDKQKRLNKIIFYLGTATVVSNDTLIYNAAGKVSSISRRSPEAAKRGTVAIEFLNDGKLLNGFTFQTHQYDNNSAQSGNNCSGGGVGIEELCLGRDVSGQNTASYEPITVKSFIDIQSGLITESLIDGFAGNKYYFHPLFILKGEFAHGNDLTAIYMIDWWDTYRPPGGGFSQVKLKYNYAM